MRLLLNFNIVVIMYITRWNWEMNMKWLGQQIFVKVVIVFRFYSHLGWSVENRIFPNQLKLWKLWNIKCVGSLIEIF